MMKMFGYLANNNIEGYANCSNAYQKIRLVEDVLHGRLISGAEIRSSDAIGIAVSNERTFLLAIRIALLHRKPVVLFCWDPPGIMLWDKTDTVSGLRRLVMKLLMGIAILLSRGMILNLHKGYVETYFPKRICWKIYSFPNGTTIDYNYAKTIGVKKVVKRIVVACNATKHKSCWGAADWFVRLWQKDPDVSLIWIGGGLYKEVWEYIVRKGVEEKNVCMTGPLSRDEALRYVATAELALNTYDNKPSLRWNYILKAPEFLSLGIPIVSKPLPGTCEYAIDGETGIVYEDDLDCVSRVLALLNDRKRLAEMDKLCRKRARQYDWKKVNQGIAERVAALISS